MLGNFRSMYRVAVPYDRRVVYLPSAGGKYMFIPLIPMPLNDLQGKRQTN